MRIKYGIRFAGLIARHFPAASFAPYLGELAQRNAVEWKIYFQHSFHISIKMSQGFPATVRLGEGKKNVCINLWTVQLIEYNDTNRQLLFHFENKLTHKVVGSFAQYTEIAKDLERITAYKMSKIFSIAPAAQEEDGEQGPEQSEAKE